LKAAGYLLAEHKPTYALDSGEEFYLRMARLTPEGKARLSDFLDFLEDWEKRQRREKKNAGKNAGPPGK